MPRAIWNGVISFGLLNIPVSLQAGQRTTDLHFRMLDSRDNARIRFERVNADTGEEVPWKDIVKAYEYERGNFVVLGDEDFQRAAPQSHDSVEIESFIDRDAINPMYFEKPYYLVPGKRAAKGYVLLREVLERSRRMAIARVVIRTREHLSVVMPLGNALVLLLIRFPQELVQPDVYELPDGKPADYRISPREMAMAEELVESMAVDFAPDQYVDDFRRRLHDAIDARIKADETVQPPDMEEIDHSPSTNVVDFMSLLKKSLQGGRRTGAKATGAAATTDADDEPSGREADNDPDSSAGASDRTGADRSRSRRAGGSPATATRTASGGAKGDGAKGSGRKAGSSARRTGTRAAAGKTTSGKTTSGKTASGKTTSGKTTSANKTGAAKTAVAKSAGGSRGATRDTESRKSASTAGGSRARKAA